MLRVLFLYPLRPSIRLNVDALKQSKNQTDDIKSAIAEIQKDNAYLFDTGKPQPQISDLASSFEKHKDCELRIITAHLIHFFTNRIKRLEIFREIFYNIFCWLKSSKKLFDYPNSIERFISFKQIEFQKSRAYFCTNCSLFTFHYSFFTFH